MSRVDPVDSLLEAGTAAQRERGLIPQVADLKRYITGIVETCERKRAEPKPPQSTKAQPPPRDVESIESEFRKRLTQKGLEVLPGKWTVDRDPRLKKFGSGKRRRKIVSHAETLMRARIRLLAAHPDWAQRVKSVNLLAAQGLMGPERKRQAEAQYRQIVTDSEAVFGPWYKEPAKPLIFDLSKK